MAARAQAPAARRAHQGILAGAAVGVKISGGSERAMADKFEEQYQDVLQNIEIALVQAYRAYLDLTDLEALDGIQALVRTYQAEAQSHKPPCLKLRPLAEEAYTNIKLVCDWRLGRATILNMEGQAPELPDPKTLDEIILCLKRIRRSIELWNKQSGRRGYFNFVSQFVR